jgi:6-phosphogluconolactonase (cycloisomerase 2 family)
MKKMDLITTPKKTGTVAVLVAGIMACTNASAAGQAKNLYTVDLATWGVKSYAINLTSGAVTVQSPVRSLSDTPFSLAGTADGKFIFGSTRSSDILTFATSSNGQLPPTDFNPPSFSVGLGVWQTVLHPNNKFAYALGTAYNITPLLVNQSTGALTSNGATIATGLGPHAVIEPTGKFLYAATGGLGFIADPVNTGQIFSYRIDQKSGALTRIQKLALQSDELLTGVSHPHAVAAAPNGKFIAVTELADAANPSLKATRTFTIGDNGTLSPAGDDMSASGRNNVAVQIHPSSGYVFVSSVVLSGGGSIVAYKATPANGALMSKASEIVLAADETPGPMAMDPSGAFLFVLLRRETNRPTASFDTSLAAFAVSSEGKLTLRARTMIEHDTGTAHSSLVDLVLGQKTQ